MRVEQLLCGAVDSKLMLLQLQLKERQDDPPTFLSLLSEIRTEEEHPPVSTMKNEYSCKRVLLLEMSPQ